MNNFKNNPPSIQDIYKGIEKAVQETTGNPISLTKKCKTCGQDKPYDQFWTNPKTKDKLKTSCIVCCREYNKLHYKQNKALILERVKLNNSKKL